MRAVPEGQASQASELNDQHENIRQGLEKYSQYAYAEGNARIQVFSLRGHKGSGCPLHGVNGGGHLAASY